jgi:hypothetical protein
MTYSLDLDELKVALGYAVAGESGAVTAPSDAVKKAMAIKPVAAAAKKEAPKKEAKKEEAKKVRLGLLGFIHEMKDTEISYSA